MKNVKGRENNLEWLSGARLHGLAFVEGLGAYIESLAPTSPLVRPAFPGGVPRKGCRSFPRGVSRKMLVSQWCFIACFLSFIVFSAPAEGAGNT